MSSPRIIEPEQIISREPVRGKTDPDPESKSALVEKRKPKRISKKEDYITFKRYLLRMSKKLKPNVAIGGTSMQHLDDFLNDILERLQDRLVDLIEVKKVKTLSARNLESATKLCLPSIMEQYAVHNARNAVLCALKKDKSNSLLEITK